MVVIDTTNTDCYTQDVAKSKKIQGLLTLKREGQFILCNDLCPPNLAEIIVQFYTMTGFNSNNGFYGSAKNSIYDKISRVSHLQDNRCWKRASFIRLSTQSDENFRHPSNTWGQSNSLTS